MKSGPLKYGIAASCVIGLNALISLPTYAAVFAPGSEVAGKTIGEWTADWWQTFLEAPATGNPLIEPDTTGESLTALNDSDSPVFFLTGSFGFPIERSVTVTSKQAILFPLVNFANIYDQ